MGVFFQFQKKTPRREKNGDKNSSAESVPTHWTLFMSCSEGTNPANSAVPWINHAELSPSNLRQLCSNSG